jgi:hypothetical protein
MWEQLDVSSHPNKGLALEVFDRVSARMPWAPPNGSRVQAMTHWVWTRFSSAKQL